MKKNGFTPLIIILVIAILGVVGYITYRNYLVKPQIPTVANQTPETEINLPVTGAINGQKNTISVGATVGTMIVLSGWQAASTSDDSLIVGKTIKTINIQSGGYAIQISTFGSGRSPCGNSDGTRGTLVNDYVYFKDQDGYEYFRQKVPSESSLNSLNVCSNGITGKGSENFGENEAIFGQISYKIPQNPDNKILNQMDNMVASFKANQ